MRLLWIVFLILAGLGCSASPSTMPTASPMRSSTQSPPGPRRSNTKGWELFLWKADGQSFYALLPKTDSRRSREEVAAVAVKSMDAVKAQLGELERGQWVVLSGQQQGEQPPPDQADALVEHCRKLGLRTLLVSQDYLENERPPAWWPLPD